MDTKTRLQRAADEAVVREQEMILAEKRARRNQLNDALVRVKQRLAESENHLTQLQNRETACKGELDELLRKRIWKCPGANRETKELWIAVAALDMEMKYGAQCSKLYEEYVTKSREEESTLEAALEELEADATE